MPGNTYLFSTNNSDLSGGAGGNKKLLLGPETASTITWTSPSLGSPRSLFAFTEPGDPSTGGTSTGSFSIVARCRVLSITNTPQIKVQLHRVNSAGVIQASSGFSSLQTITGSVANYTFPFTNPTLGTWLSGDRLLVEISFGHAAATSRTIELTTGGTDSKVDVPWGGLEDAATVTFALTPSSADIGPYSDAATAALKLTASGTEAQVAHVLSDAATVPLRFKIPSDDVGAVRLALTPSAEDAGPVTDAATAKLLFTPFGTPGAREDVNTVRLALTPSGIDTFHQCKPRFAGTLEGWSTAPDDDHFYKTWLGSLVDRQWQAELLPMEAVVNHPC